MTNKEYIVNFDMQEDYKSFPVIWSKMPEEILNLPCGDLIINDTFKIEEDGSLSLISVAILERKNPDEFLSKNSFDVISANNSKYYVPLGEVIDLRSIEDLWDDNSDNEDDI